MAIVLGTLSFGPSPIGAKNGTDELDPLLIYVFSYLLDLCFL